MANNITKAVKNKLCTGCGVCEDVCPNHCITIQNKNGENRPVLDTTLCLGDKCGRCLKVCPGVGVNLAGLSKKLFSGGAVKEDNYVGRYIGLHTGYSNDYDIRFHSASGGLVTQLLIYLLEKGVIDGAVVTAYGEDHITPRSFIARTKEELIEARSSKYCPVSLNNIGNEIVNSSKCRFVIVGTPCHIQGFRKRALIDRRFRDKVIGYFAIYCSSNRTYKAQDFLFHHYGVDKKSISYFAYRDNGCLGNLTINKKDGSSISVPYSNYYGSMLRSFFKPHRCLTCIDHYGKLADICFGDIHIKPYSEDKVGINSCITRSEFWEIQLQNALHDGFVSLGELNVDTLNASQAKMLYPKKRRVYAVMNMDHLIGRETPVYDEGLEKPFIKDYISEFICHIQRFIGRHRYLWWIIKLCRKK